MRENVLELFSEPTANWFENTFKAPTEVQKRAWPAIASGKSVLVSAPTGTGKTLTAFLMFLDRLLQSAQEGKLEEGVQLVYISPLKSLAADIRENLRRPLEGIGAQDIISVAVRTGDTPQKERQKMAKRPPCILITTPESLYLMLTSKSGHSMLRTAKAVVIDELHALIDTKRGAHLLFSIARLEKLCGRKLQRIGLSATIEPLDLAAGWLSPKGAVIVAPAMKKEKEITVVGTTPAVGKRKDPIWEELAGKVYERCQKKRSVIAFSEGRRYAEKLAYYVNQIAGEDFARVHHGSMSKEQRQEAEEALREGRLRLLCATSSMELGIDVGEVDEVLQIGCPKTVSSAMQRLGRAGHSPGRVSVMRMYPRTAAEGLYCGMTAALAAGGGVEETRPPRGCLDVLAQHLVSMAAYPAKAADRTAAAAEKAAEEEEAVAVGEKTMKEAAVGSSRSPRDIAYSVDDVLELAKRAWPFTGVTRETIKRILAMLAGDYEHNREIPVRPRILYDRIHEVVYPDPYSRMLAVAAGGTIPDKGLYTVKTLDGVKLGELDEEFVYESYIGDRFLLGAFGWKMVNKDKDTVYVEPAPADSARVPFWKGEIKGRSLKTSKAFGGMLRMLSRAAETEMAMESANDGGSAGTASPCPDPDSATQPSDSNALLEQQPGSGILFEQLSVMGLDGAAAKNAADFIKRQVAATGALPDDRTIIAEHFCDHTGSHQLMIHSLFGRRINAPLSIVLQHAVREKYHINAGCVDEEDGILLYPYGEEKIPERLFSAINSETVEKVLEAALPGTPLFGMTFRYNAARALMVGMRKNGRQPLWLQRLRSTEMLDSLINVKGHPLIEQTYRECLEELWDIEGLKWVLSGIASGLIAVREVYADVPSPMSLPLQWQVEAAEMYSYAPVTEGIRQAAYEELKAVDQLKPAAEELKKVQERKKLPENAGQLHSLLMMEGDLEAAELNVPGEWLEQLAQEGRALYIEPGLWIAAEQKEEYEKAFAGDEGSLSNIVRRMLYYRGPQTLEGICGRYFLETDQAKKSLTLLKESDSIVEDEGVFYHAKLYERAQKATIRSLRSEAVTQPPEKYAALMAGRVYMAASPAEQLKETVRQFCGQGFAPGFWEEVLFPARVRDYREQLLDSLLAEGDYFWRFLPDGQLSFECAQDTDWESRLAEPALEKEEQALYDWLVKRGASFARQLSRIAGISEETDVQETLINLAQKGLVNADSFVPVRQWLLRDSIAKATVRQRVSARVQAMAAGRWDVVHSVKSKTAEEWLEQLFTRNPILCRETFRKPEETENPMTWQEALSVLRVWEYVGKVRRGYFVSGMSGAQFIRKEDYTFVTQALAAPCDEIVWLHAQDPYCLWGKALPMPPDRSFMSVPGTAVALRGGRIAAVFERKGRTFRVFEPEKLKEVLGTFAKDFKNRRLYAGQKRLVVKEYPPEAAAALKAAGFMKEMQDYVLYL